MTELSSLPTYIYVDASNIKNACSRSSHFELDFQKMIQYFRDKYPNLVVIKYFEWIAKGDIEALSRIDELKNIWYSVYLLERKSYHHPAVMKDFTCTKCSNTEKIEAVKEKVDLKSNIDVFLASEFMYDSSSCPNECHLILVSCDWDYAEMIKKVFYHYPKIKISVIATPKKKAGEWMNYLSTRFKALKLYDNFTLVNIESIRDYLTKK